MIDDELRIAFTRLRLSSHRLRIETGRWLKPPTARDQRLCECGSVQTELHVIAECPLVHHLRIKYDLSNIDFHKFISDEKSASDLRFIRDVFYYFKD